MDSNFNPFVLSPTSENNHMVIEEEDVEEDQIDFLMDEKKMATANWASKKDDDDDDDQSYDEVKEESWVFQIREIAKTNLFRLCIIEDDVLQLITIKNEMKKLFNLGLNRCVKMHHSTQEA